MKIEHLAIWANDIEKLREFYVKYFGLKQDDKYSNQRKGFSSYFLSFESGARLEIMQMSSVEGSGRDPVKHYAGFAHLAISVGSKEKVNLLTSLLKTDGYIVLDGPRTTGDSYYESIVLDPEDNRIEITV
ncbi:MAG: glyoxalase [Anaerolineales bacterium]|nr:MAG: glyoxalase [Anaerolineales bacterium]